MRSMWLRPHRRRVWLTSALTVLISSQALSADASARPGSRWERPVGGEVVRIEVVSNRADLVSGGDALVEVVLPSAASAESLRVDVDGRDVSEAFAVRADGRLLGLVEGLKVGRNVVTARLPNGRGARLTITNHPSGGPILFGPQVQPWACNPGAVNAHCEYPATYEFFYVPVNATRPQSTFPFGVLLGQATGFRPYDPESPPPAGTIAQTTTDEGETVPFIVRVETGSMARGEYQVAVLFDPARPWEPLDPQGAWNGKVVADGGFGCGISYSQGTAADIIYVLPDAISRGFAAITSTLFYTGSKCNVVMQAEALMMLKEHVAETYGPILYTLGVGGSGKSIFQQWVSNAYPGLFDGLVPSWSYPDTGTTRAVTSMDCAVLKRHFEDSSLWAPGVVWDPASQTAAYGSPQGSCDFIGGGNMGNSPRGACDVPPDQRYDSTTNPGGVRCSYWDYAVSQVGRRPAAAWTPAEQAIGRGFANRPIDNVGVQYGLEALEAGRISTAQFVDLNVNAGAYDIDGNWQPQRIEADPAGLRALYRTGLLNQGNNMATVPIIDVRGPDAGTFGHDHFRAWQMRARLDRAQGHHDNHVIWWGPLWQEGDVTFQSSLMNPIGPNLLAANAFDAMDRWVAAIKADTSDLTLAEKVIANKPADVHDRCTNGLGMDAPCVIPDDPTPRMVAGGPLTEDVAKCHLKPLRRTDYYPLTFTNAQWAQLEATFPTGVCDFSKPPVGQQLTIPWATYKNGPGGTRLARPPASAPF